MKKTNAMAFIIAVFSALMFFSENISADQPYHQPLHFVFLLAVACYIYMLYRRRPDFVLSGFYQIYSFIGMMISSVIIGSGAYMIEVNQTGTSNGTFWTAIFFFVAGTEASFLAFRKSPYLNFLRNSQRLSEITASRMIRTIASVVIIAGAVILFEYSSPLFIGIDRITYWRQIVPSPLSLYPSLLAQTFFLCAYLYLMKENKKFIDLFLIVTYVLCTVIVAGEKFSAFVLFIFVWLTLQSTLYHRQCLDFLSIAKWLAVLLLVLVIVIVSYILSDKEATFVLVRAALQAQLLWSVLNEDGAILLAGHNWPCYVGCQSFENITDFISERYLPSDLWSFYSESGARLTGFMPAVPILVFGIPGALLIHVFISAMLGVLQKQTVCSISDRNLVTSFLLFKIYLGCIIFWYSARVQVLVGVCVTLAALMATTLIMQKK